MTYRYDNSEVDRWAFGTRSIHAGQPVDATGARNMPIYNTASYVFDSCENAAKRFSLAEDGPIYTRLNNPTITALEERMASLEGGSCAVAFASGMAAITATVLNLASAGDHIVSSPRLYGGTLTLFEFTLARLGIEVTFVDDPDDPQSWRDAVRPNTKLFFAESTANPLADILDVPAVAAVAHEAKVPFVVDNTVPTAALIRPLELGADVVVASLTKFYTGNSTGIGGIAIDGGTFDWTVTRDEQPIFPSFANPDPTYHGIVYADLGEMAFGVKLRVGVLRDIGGCLSPFNAWVTLQGLDTLELRIQRHCSNALKVAQFLADQPQVTKVNYPGLPSSPWYPVKEKLGLDGVGAVLSFDIKGGRKEAWAFIDALKLHSNVANIGDSRSLVVHPATTTHAQCDERGQEVAGITEATIRLSIGLESPEDIIDDLKLGFAALSQA